MADDPADVAGGMPWRDPQRPPRERVADLLSRLTTQEKITLLHQYGAAVPRLGLAAFRTGTEALHGVAWLGEATVFPQAVGLGATWNPGLVAEVGRATSVEVRAKHALDPTVSLNVWAPVVNLLRDPRWGRNEEGYSEDPLHTWRTAIAYCRGLRGDHPRYVRTAPTLKHFLAYNNETRRSETSSDVPPRVLHEYDLPVFERPIRAGVVDAVMPAYNLVGGNPCHVSPLLRLLRSWARGTGHELVHELVVVSDAEAPSNLVETQHAYPDHPTGHAAALRAGIDSFTDHGDDPAVTTARLAEALHRGLITVGDLDRAAGRVLGLRLRTGEFDPRQDPYAAIGAEALHRPEHRELARRAAREQVVLLRNVAGLLPLRAQAGRRLAVVGPFADTLRWDLYSGTPPYQVTILDGLRAALEPAGTAVVTAEGLDRITLLSRSTRRYVAVDGSALVLSPAPSPVLSPPPGSAGDTARFDVADWGDGELTLRNAASGRYVSGRTDAGALTADADRPNGWEVSETFTLVPVTVDAAGPGGPAPAGQDGGGASPAGQGASGSSRVVVIRQVRTGAYVRLGAGGTDGVDGVDDTELIVDAPCIDDAEQFVVEQVRDGAEHVLEVLAGEPPADDVVLVLGSDPFLKGRETLDRTTLALPPTQERLLRAVTGAHPRTVLVLMSGYPYALGGAADAIPAIVWTSHAGQETGHALAEILLGVHAPSGRLPQTWYRSDADLPDLLEYDIIGARRTYQYFTGSPLFPFGHGLTYTTFGYGPVTATVDEPGDGRDDDPDDGAGAGGADQAGPAVRVHLQVTNTGDRAATDVVQVYAHQVPPEGTTPRSDLPRRRLVAFERVPLEPGTSAKVTLTFPVASLARWDPAVAALRVEPGRYELLMGRSCEQIVATTLIDVTDRLIDVMDRLIDVTDRLIDVTGHPAAGTS